MLQSKNLHHTVPMAHIEQWPFATGWQCLCRWITHMYIPQLLGVVFYFRLPSPGGHFDRGGHLLC